MSRVQQWAKEQNKMQEYFNSLDDADKKVTIRLAAQDYSLLCAVAGKVGANPTAAAHDILTQALWDAWEGMGLSVDDFFNQFAKDTTLKVTDEFIADRAKKEGAG